MNTAALKDLLMLDCSTLEAALFPAYDMRGAPADPLNHAGAPAEAWALRANGIA